MPDDDSVGMMRELISCQGVFVGEKGSPRVSLLQFNTSLIQAPIRVVGSIEEIHRFSNPSVFTRLYYSLMFPEFERIIYLDADVIVLGDICDLWDVDLHGSLIGAVGDSFTISNLFFPTTLLESIFFSQYYTHIDVSSKGFNNGVYVMDLKQYRDNSIVDQVHYWMWQQYEHGLYIIATQPLTQLISYGNWLPIDPSWNVLRLGNEGSDAFTNRA